MERSQALFVGPQSLYSRDDLKTVADDLEVVADDRFGSELDRRSRVVLPQQLGRLDRSGVPHCWASCEFGELYRCRRDSRAECSLGKLTEQTP